MSSVAHGIALNAARKSKIDSLRAALEISSEVRDTLRNDGWKPLRLASREGRKECVELLL
jgi:ankyrin repeat protein